MQASDIKDLLSFNDPKLEIKEAELAYFGSKLKELAGISIKESKSELLKGRLRNRLHAHRFTQFAEYKNFLESLPPDHSEWQAFINLLTTNKTDFFREPKHFDYLTQQFLPYWLKHSKEKTLKIWSCAASTGEEAYSLAMHLSSLLPTERDFKILSTDIDTNVLKKARNGVYSMDRYSQIPEIHQKKFTDRGTAGLEDWFRIKPSLKKHVQFETYNLIDPKLPSDESYDLIFCRNVFIYFGKETITDIINRLYGAASPGGFLFIGHSESIQNLNSKWKSVKPAIYRRE